MSLIRVRRRRKQNWIDVRRGMSSGRLLVILAAVIALMWFLGRI